MRPYELTAEQIARLVKRGELSPMEVTDDTLNRLDETEPLYHAFIRPMHDEARRQALEVADRLASGGEDLPLAGVPVAVKDNLCMTGIPTTCASRILEGYVSPYDATVVEKLRKAGAVIVGKTNMDEFAMGSSTENSAFFSTLNPCDPSRVPGGSSGGSAASVRCGSAALSLGSDTGGSIRQPASFCGLVGLKPTYGRVSRYGLVAFASSLDQIGPFARNVADCALLTGVIAGHDPHDSTCLETKVPDYESFLSRGVKGLRVGVPVEYFRQGIDKQVDEVVRRAIETLAGLGAVVEETSLPHTEYSLPAYYIIAPAEASSNLARYDGVRYGHRAQKSASVLDMYCRTRDDGFGPEVKRRIMIGTYALSSGYYDAYYLRALKVRRLVREDFDAAFKKFDLLVTPATPTAAFKVGAHSGDPIAMYMSDLCTTTVNLAGLPAMSMPCGFTSNEGRQLPIGLQLISGPLREDLLFRAGAALEEALGLAGWWPEEEARAI